MTLKLLDHWPEFDRNDNLTGRRIIGIKAEPIAVILKGPHHVEFLRLAKYAPDMLAALEEVAQAEKLLASTITTSAKVQVLISAKALRLVKAAIAKAKGQ